MSTPTLAELLERHEGDLRRWVAARSGSLLRYETEDDLVQGVHVRALGNAAGFAYRSEPEFRAWMFRVGRAFLADRYDYWTAAQRAPGRLLRLTESAPSTGAGGAVVAPPRDTAGPATRADRREALDRAERALDLLPPRDASLVRGHAEGRSLEDEAQRLDLSYAAVQRARLRALERFRKAYRLLERSP